MTPAEFARWAEFYRRWPFDDLHRFHRPAALVAGAMSGDANTMRARLEWLQPSGEQVSEADAALYAAAGVSRVAGAKPSRQESQ